MTNTYYLLVELEILLYNFFMEYIVSNFITLSLILGMLVLVLTGKAFSNKVTRNFLSGIICVFFVVVFNILDVYLRSFDKLNYFRYVTSSFGYVLRPLLIIFIILIINRNRKKSILAMIPFFFLVVVSFTSPFTHFMYWFTEDNQFQRGPLGFLSHIVSAYYMTLMIVFSLKIRHSKDIGEIFTLLYIFLICIVGTVLETVFHQDFLLSGAMIVSCAVYYLYLNVMTYKRDALTDLLNRRSFFVDGDKYKKYSFYIISIDLNELKMINDTKGHQEGDKALCELSRILVDYASTKFRCYRTGGDEFIVLAFVNEEQFVIDYIQNVKNSLKESSYMASIGYELYDKSDKFEDICDKADEKMYEDKKRYRHRSR